MREREGSIGRQLAAKPVGGGLAALELLAAK